MKEIDPREKNGLLPNICNMCGCSPCETPSACRCEAEYENHVKAYMTGEQDFDNPYMIRIPE